MTFHLTCNECEGEGYRTLPPYSFRKLWRGGRSTPEQLHHAALKPFRWRSKDPCDGCNGTGLTEASLADIVAYLRENMRLYSGEHAGTFQNFVVDL